MIKCDVPVSSSMKWNRSEGGAEQSREDLTGHAKLNPSSDSRNVSPFMNGKVLNVLS